jgi:hypothetical protein
MKRTLSATLIAALPLAGLLWLGGAVPLPVALAAMAVFAFVVLCAGFVLLRAASAEDMPPAAAWVLGVFATALAVYALVQWFQLLAATAFAIWAVLMLGCAVAWRRRTAPFPGFEIKELLGLLLCGAATVLWCRDIAEVPQILAREYVLPAWIDYFIHGGVISQFGDVRAGRQAIHLADYPAPFYHYASYMLPAVFAGALDLPGLPAATSVWLPLGFFTMCAGAYSLGAALAGPAGGIAAVAALTVLPDASNYGARNGFLSFHWHVLALPGAPYATGVFLLSISLFQRWLSMRNPRALLASAGLAGGALLFRIHLFSIGFPAMLAAAAMSTRFVQGRKLAFFAAALAAFCLFVAGFYNATGSGPALELFLTAVHGHQEPTGYTGLYAHLLETYGPGIGVPLGMLLVFAACLGAFAILYPVSVLLAWRCGRLHAVDLVPVSLIGCYALLMLTAPAVHWDPTELTVRPFVLLYAVIAIWTLAAFVNWLASRAAVGANRAWRGLLLATSLALLVIWPQTGKLGLLPKFQWGWRFYPHKVEPGVPETAAYLRRNWTPGDRFAVQGLKLGWAPTDPAIQIASLSGIPAYLAYTIAHVADKGERRNVALERYDALTRVAGAQDVAEALDQLRRLGIRWYVVIADEGPGWDPQRRHAAFVAGRVAVYSSRQP